MTTGASDDIKRATRIAREMVVTFGMSSLGPINLGPDYDDDYGNYLAEPSKVGDETQRKIDIEVKKIMDEAFEKAKIILKEQRTKLDAVAEELLKVETLDGDRFKQIMNGDTNENSTSNQV